MKLLSVITAAALATVSFSAAAAPAGFVSYSCDGGKSLNVMYGFDRSGRAVTADVNEKTGGKKASLVVNKKRSDSTGTTFTNRRGYAMSAGFIDKNTHTTSEVVGVNAPNGSFLVKNCEPRPR